MSKGFLSAFYPDEWVDSAYSIDYEKWYARGFRAVIFDIDNTLVPHGEACRCARQRAVSPAARTGLCHLPDLQQSASEGEAFCGCGGVGIC